MNRYAASIDRRDWPLLRTVFADGEIEADATSMGVKQVFRGPAERWVDAESPATSRPSPSATATVG